MSNPPPWHQTPLHRDRPALRAEMMTRGIYEESRFRDSLPHELQQLLSDITRTCYSLCSDDTEAANAVTRDVCRLLLQLLAAIEAKLESDPNSDLHSSSESWHLLGRLVDGTACPHCRRSFREHLCIDIATALQHQVHEDGSVVWTAARQRRLAALNVVAQLPEETLLSDSIAYGVLRSCLVAEVDVAAAALRSGRLSVAIEVIPRAEAMEWFAQSVHARVGCPSIAQPSCTMKCVVFHVLVTFTVCLQAAAAVLIADKADIVTAAYDADFDLVLLHLIADPASANECNEESEYNTRSYTTYMQKFNHNICFVCDVLILAFSVERLLCIGLLVKVTWTFASFS
jgi:hypothetical protein